MAIVLAAFGCKRKRDPAESDSVRPQVTEEADPSADGAAPPAPQPPSAPPQCEPSKTPTSFYLRGRSASEEAGEGGVDQPFAVELGGATVVPSGFAVGALRHDEGRTEAVIALTDPDAARGSLVSLGRVHGSPEPPRLTAKEGTVVFAVVDSDASGPTLRLGRFEVAQGETSLAWGAEVQQGRDESDAFSVAVAGTRGLLAWDDYDRAKKHSVVRLLSFALDPWGKVEPVRSVTPAGEDADAPLLAARPGGYWLAWIAHEAASGAPPREGAATDEEGAVVDAGPSRLRIVPLDEKGAPIGEPRSVTEQGSQVVVFDLVAGSDGRAYLAWREEARAPGASGGVLQVAAVAADGSTEVHQVEAAGLDAGLPVLLPAEAAEGVPEALWLAANGAQAELLLGLVTATGVEDLRVESALTARQALAAGHGRVLFAQPRGRDVMLETARCQPRPASAPEEARPAEGSGPAVPQEEE